MLTDKIDNKIETADRKVKEGTDRLYDEADNMRREAKSYAQDTLSKGEENWGQVRDTAQRFWNKAKETGQKVEQDIVEYTKDNFSAFQQYAQKRPLQVAAAALAIGVVLGGALFASTRRD